MAVDWTLSRDEAEWLIGFLWAHRGIVPPQHSWLVMELVEKTGCKPPSEWGELEPKD